MSKQGVDLNIALQVNKGDNHNSSLHVHKVIDLNNALQVNNGYNLNTALHVSKGDNLDIA